MYQVLFEIILYRDYFLFCTFVDRLCILVYIKISSGLETEYAFKSWNIFDKLLKSTYLYNGQGMLIHSIYINSILDESLF